MIMDLGLKDILDATRGKVLAGTLEAPVEKVSIDSRAVGPGSLFIPLVGSRADGHDYIAQARAAGAVCLVKKGHPASQGAAAGRPGPALIEVDEPLAALGDLAAYWRRRFNAKIVAITGSNGKTSTKEMAACIIGKKFRTMKNPGNFNNLIGLPLSLLQLDGSCEVAVLELGMSEPGEIARLADICDPDIVESSMTDCDRVINFAAETHVDRSIEDAAGFIRTDIEGVRVLLEEFRKWDRKVFVGCLLRNRLKWSMTIEYLKRVAGEWLVLE